MVKELAAFLLEGAVRCSGCAGKVSRKAKPTRVSNKMVLTIERTQASCWSVSYAFVSQLGSHSRNLGSAAGSPTAV